MKKNLEFWHLAVGYWLVSSYDIGTSINHSEHTRSGYTGKLTFKVTCGVVSDKKHSSSCTCRTDDYNIR